MTVPKPKNESIRELVFLTSKELRPEPQAEKTDEEIRAEMKASVRRNASVLRTLSKL